MNETSASEILRVVNDMTASFQGTMTDGERATLNARHANDPESAACAAGSREEAMIEFTADALLTLAQDMQSVLDGRRESAYREALDVYYAAEELAVAQHRGPVDDDVADALGEVVRVFVRGDVADGPRIEDDDVRLLAGGEDAAVREAGARRSERRHLPHRLLQRKQMLVADVV